MTAVVMRVQSYDVLYICSSYVYTNSSRAGFGVVSGRHSDASAHTQDAPAARCAAAVAANADARSSVSTGGRWRRVKAAAWRNGASAATAAPPKAPMTTQSAITRSIRNREAFFANHKSTSAVLETLIASQRRSNTCVSYKSGGCLA